MEVLRSILEGSLSKNQLQKAKATQRARYPPYSVERSRLNNADKNINKKVYEMEKAQAEAYNLSTMPEDPITIGKIYKIQAYANPLMATVAQKIDLSKQLTTSITFAREQTKRGVQTSAGAVIYTPQLLENSYFTIKDALSDFNRMMTYIATYAPQIINSTATLDKLNQGIFNPITQLLGQLQTTYGNFWNTLPDYNNEEQKLIRQAVRAGVERCYSVYGIMRENLQNSNFTPITDADINTYARVNDVKNKILTNPVIPPPAPMPIPPTQPAVIPNIPQQQPAPAPMPPVIRASNITPPDQGILGQFRTPADIRNTSGQTISSQDYFYLLGLVWTNREEEFLVQQQIPTIEQDIAGVKANIASQTRRLNEIQGQQGREQLQADLEQQIRDFNDDLRLLENELKRQNARKVRLFGAQELIQEYLREVAKLPTDAEGNIAQDEIDKIDDRDLRTLANNEGAFRASVGLVGWGRKKGGQRTGFYHQNDEVAIKDPTMSDYMRILPITDDHMDRIPIHTSEFEMKRRMADRARGDPRILEPDQNIPTRMAMFPEDSEFNPSWELLKRGFKANDTVMEPDRTMADIMPSQSGRYEASGIPDDENATAFKQRFGLPYSQHAKRTNDRPVVAEHRMPFGGFFDIDGNDEFNSINTLEGILRPVEHFKTQEEPDDILEHPDEFKRKIESYRFNTGRMKTKPSFMK